MSENYDPLDWAHPLVRDWFIHKFGTPTEPQIQGWPSILANKLTLISAPTGSGKTFAAFLVAIDQLVRKSLNNELPDQTQVIYVSPLKALSNDIQKNLNQPLMEIEALAKSQGLAMPEIRVAVRTGDTLPRDRQSMLRKPPHILVTTPESFYILLTAEKSRALLTTVKTVIVDEIHAMVNDKRGTHLALSLERLETITHLPLTRIGLSATQKPIETVAEFLKGNRLDTPTIINIGYARHLDIAIEIPPTPLGSVATNEMWEEIYNRIAELVKEHRSTLVFVNTRRLAERVAHHLTERLGEDKVATHHGSLSRKLRLAAETRLKNGELSVLVATASLELGIDIGSIDLVCQIGSPRSIAIALQRVGRAGHWRGAISKGRIFATTRDELVECAALVHAIEEDDLDQLIIPEEPLDILAQQIVAICATGDWLEEDLFELIKKAYPYKNLSRQTFNEILSMLADGIAGSRGRYGTYLFRDQINGMVKSRRNARITAIMNGGAIPETGLFSVIAEPTGTMVGTLDEDFAVESNRGDIILLGTTSWKINRVESGAGRVIVEDAHGAPPSVPFWRGEAPARSDELSLQVSELRQKVSELIPDPSEIATALSWLQQHCKLSDDAAQQLIDYLLQGRALLGAVPTQNTIIAERFFDESGGMQLIIHSPFGSRINKAWGLALRKRFCRSFNFELQAAATEDGINISLAEQHSFPLADVFQFLHPNTIKEVLIQAILQSPLFTTRWRWDATRALALTRFRYGKKIPPNIQRMLSDDLLAAVFPDAAACQDNLGGKEIELPDHPLIKETMKDALTEALDIDGLTNLLTHLYQGKIQYLAVDTPLPSVFAHEILNANPYAFLDDAPLEERRARAVEMRRHLPETLLQEIGKLDPAAITEIQNQAWPDIRNEDELHDFLQTLIALPVNSDLIATEWQTYWEKLVESGRGATATLDEKIFWLATEKANVFRMIYPAGTIIQKIKEIPAPVLTHDEALTTLLKGWFTHLGPTTIDELSHLFKLDQSTLEPVILQLESSGMILRGHFRFSDATKLEWCERRLLARIHRLTLDRLRKEIDPISKEKFFQWLLTWQHVTDETRLSGEKGLLNIISQLQGFELPANAWENILSSRMKDYDRFLLDRLCLKGVIGWGRLSPLQNIAKRKRFRPTRVAPITFFVREESDWLPKNDPEFTAEKLQHLSHVAKNIFQFLQQKGASFFPDIAKNVKALKSELETGLWELIAVGLVTADDFDNLRALIDSRRRKDPKRRRSQARFSTGRWSLFNTEEIVDPAKQVEAITWVLLKRYGVVFRDLLAKEKNIPRWRDLLITLRRLEDRGEVRGGRFVSGFRGEQFALPYAVESLRAMRNQSITVVEKLLPIDPIHFS